MKKTLLTYLMSLIAFVTYAQTGQVSGRIVDAETGEGLFGANAAIKGTSKGAMADFDGAFTITGVEAGEQTLVISYVGYEAFEKKFTIKAGESVDLGALKLQGGALNMEAVEVLADVAVDRKTPVAVSTIKPELIVAKLGNQEYPEILKTTPGVYATKQGGGFGDSRINLRGFSSNNVAVMINGVPVNDMESGWVYWSNWAGLSDVTRSMQVQRGLGASKVAVPSVGGTINILTKSTDMKKGGSVIAGVGNDGYQKYGLTLSTGLMENGWAVTVLGAATQGDGWADATWFKGYSYFFNVSKQINDNHTISLTGFGAPQTHGQRRYKQKVDVFLENGLRYNSNWGYKNGEMFNESVNYYHKPQYSLNHYWTVNDKMNVNTAAYLSTGTGGGTGSYGSYLRNAENGLVNWDEMVRINQENGLAGASSILRSSRNDHFWYGVLSSVDYKLSDNFTVLGGIDLRSYTGKHFRTVDNLLGGEFLIEDNNINRNGDGEFSNYTVKEGDVFDYNNDGNVRWFGGFLQGEYSNDIISAFLSTSVTQAGYQRVDYFNYLDSDPEQTSPWVNFLGYSVKGGANYNLNEYHNVFANAGYFERAPYFNSVFLNYRNDLNPDAKNERVLSFEAGYGFRSSTFVANLNAYYTSWMDKGFVKRLFNPDGTEFNANLTGVNALHKGVELDFEWRPIDGLSVRGMGSLGDWTWDNNIANAELYNDSRELLSIFHMNVKGLRVGDAAQTTASLGVDYEIFENLNVGGDFVYYDNLFADFAPTDYAIFSDKSLEELEASGELAAPEQSWELPAYGLLDMNMSYKFKIAGMDARIFGKVNNLLNTRYVSESDNNGNVFLGVGRTWSTSLKLKF